jgi:hypothetical protein
MTGDLAQLADPAANATAVTSDEFLAAVANKLTINN